MNEPDGTEPREQDLLKDIDPPRPRAVGAPLAMGGGGRSVGATLQGEARRVTPIAGPAPAQDRIQDRLHNRSGDRSEDPSEGRLLTEPDDPAVPGQPTNLQRAVKGMRMALPFVQRVLPLLDGQVLAAISNLLAPRQQTHSPVNLAPLEDGLVDLKTKHRELRDQVAEQNTSLKRVEDRLEMVREATDRNTLEQQELLEDLKKVGRKVTVFAVVTVILLLGSIAINVLLYLYMRGILR
jgi:hypothetical protein